jgi:predicted acylesterase/phospholipase RssA
LLAGGGIRVAWQSGVIKALAEAGITFDHLDGTSGGTLTLAMMLSGVTPDDMCARWRALDPTDFVSPLPAAEYFHAGGTLGFGGTDGLVRRVFPALGIDVDRIRAAPAVPIGTFNVCNFDRKTVRAVAHSELTLDLLVAGVSLPGLMPPVVTEGATWLDAVWIKDTNVREAVRRGAEEIYLVWCIGNTPEYRRGVFHEYVHMIELSANGVLFEELAWLGDLNRSIESGHSPFGQRRPIRLVVIKPEVPLPLDPSFVFGVVDGDTLVAQGYDDARRRLDRADEDDPLDARCTVMRSTGKRVTMRERFEGVLEASKGGGAIRVSLAVQIADLDAFRRDGSSARVHGWTEIRGARAPWFGGALEIQRSDHRKLVYRGRFALHDASYDVAVVRALPGSLLSGADLAHAMVEIRRAGDTGAPNVTRLAWPRGEWLRFFDGVRAVEADDLAEAAASVTAFSAFLAGASDGA